MNYQNLIDFCEANNISTNDAIGLLKRGMKAVEARETARVKEKERRDLANEALRFYRVEKGL